MLYRERDLLLVPYWADRGVDVIQWPPFLLASKVYFLHFTYHYKKRKIVLSVNRFVFDVDPNSFRHGQR